MLTTLMPKKSRFLKKFSDFAIFRCLVSHYFWSSLRAFRNNLSFVLNGMSLNLKYNKELIKSASRRLSFRFNGMTLKAKLRFFRHALKLDQKKWLAKYLTTVLELTNQVHLWLMSRSLLMLLWLSKFKWVINWRLLTFIL